MHLLPILAFLAQTTFDVATIKPIDPSSNAAESSNRAVVQVTPDSLTLLRYNLADCLQFAYNLKEYQVTGPDSIYTGKYEIRAKTSAPATRAEMARMLQTLLADRFHLQFHREDKEMSVFALTLAKNGPKLHPASPGDPRMDRLPGGLHLGFHHYTLSSLAEFLSSLVAVGRPVVDATSLPGDFDFDLDLTEAAPPQRPGEQPVAGVSMTTALQEQLGLRFEPRKALIPVIVVDRFLRIPLEN